MGYGSFKHSPKYIDITLNYQLGLLHFMYVYMTRETPCNIELSAQFINLAHNDGQ